jgi:hypothetical protein
LENGRVPVERLIAARPTADAAVKAVAAADRNLAQHRSPWLVPPLARRFDRARSQLASAGARAESARFLVAEAPRLLGADRPRRYFLAVQSEAEIRGAGGFLGSYAEILADQGKLSLVHVGRSSDLNNASTGPPITPDAPPDFQRRYRYDFLDTWQDVLVSPSFPADAQLIRGLYPQSGGAPVDAVVAIDPFTIQAFLRVVGPVQVPGASQPLTGENAAKFLLFDQYVGVADTEQGDRHEMLAEITRELWQRLVGRPVDVLALGRALQPMVAQKHLMASAGAASEDPAFARAGITGEMRPLLGDSLAVVSFNANPNKIDWFLRRKIDYHVVHDPVSGALQATAAITLTNGAPAQGLPKYILGNNSGLPAGTNHTSVAFYSPLLLTGATLDGAPLLVDAQAELGRTVYSAVVDIPPGGSRTVVLDLVGATARGQGYRLDIHRQPSAAADDLTVRLEQRGGGSFTQHYDVLRDEVIPPRPPG